MRLSIRWNPDYHNCLLKLTPLNHIFPGKRWCFIMRSTIRCTLQIWINWLQELKFENKDFETIIKFGEGPIFNNAALAWNHTFYFSGLIPGNNHILKGSFADVIKRSFGSVRFFKETFTRSAVSLLGPGWVWLVLNPKGPIEIIHENNAGNPLRRGLIPLLTCDVWEHAYYLDYQNRLSDYLEAFWKLINWELIEKRYNDAI